MTNKFTITHSRKVYNCYSEISGTNVLSQTIIVEGIGVKSDPAPYGNKYRPVESMDSTAKIIAYEIVKENINID